MVPVGGQEVVRIAVESCEGGLGGVVQSTGELWGKQSRVVHSVQ